MIKYIFIFIAAICLVGLFAPSSNSDSNSTSKTKSYGRATCEKAERIIAGMTYYVDTIKCDRVPNGKMRIKYYYRDGGSKYDKVNTAICDGGSCHIL